MSSVHQPIKFSFFEGYESPLSTTRYSNFEMDGRQFNSVEQCFQFNKAEFFQNNELAMKIVKDGNNPLEAQRLGDSLDTHLAGVNWPVYAKTIMEKANMAKFKQNEGFRKYLFKTKDSHLVYCNSEDQFWGIGLKKANPKKKESVNWLGPNHLGDILVRVRAMLMKDPAYQKELVDIEKEQEVNRRKYVAKLEKQQKKVKTTP